MRTARDKLASSKTWRHCGFGVCRHEQFLPMATPNFDPDFATAKHISFCLETMQNLSNTCVCTLTCEGVFSISMSWTSLGGYSSKCLLSDVEKHPKTKADTEKSQRHRHNVRNWEISRRGFRETKIFFRDCGFDVSGARMRMNGYVTELKNLNQSDHIIAPRRIKLWSRWHQQLFAIGTCEFVGLFCARPFHSWHKRNPRVCVNFSQSALS